MERGFKVFLSPHQGKKYGSSQPFSGDETNSRVVSVSLSAFQMARLYLLSDIFEESAFLCPNTRKIKTQGQVPYKLRQRVVEESTDYSCFSFMNTYTLSHRI